MENRAEKPANVRVDVGRLVSLKKAAEAAAKKSAANGQQGDWRGDEQFASRYPNLYAILAASLVDLDCDPGATLTMWLSPDGWFAVLSPRWMGLKAFRSAPTLEGLLEALESFLSDPEPDWRSDEGRRVKRSGKAKGKPGGKH